MVARLKRTVAIFVGVLIAFGAYHVAAVPFIAPEFEVVVQPPPPPFDPKDPKTLTPYFPPGSWELDNPKVLEGDQSKLLFKEYRNLDNNRVELKPCSIVYFPSGETSGSLPQRVIVLQARSALLQFDDSSDLQRYRFGQLQTGKMMGPVTIHGTPSRPGANDELFADTSDVQLTPEKITTDAPVNFRFGPNDGHGRQMEIRLRPSNKTAAGQQRGPNVGGLESFELLHDVRMRLVPGSGGLLPMDGQRNQKPIATAAAVPSPPVDVRCQGPFKFDLVQYVAKFQDQVDVIRAAQDGPADQMNCDWLAVYFAPKTEYVAVTGNSVIGPADSTKPKTDTQRIPNLEPKRIVARGTPVIVNGEASGVFARVEHLDYEPAEAGPLGRLQSSGPGWIRYVLPQSTGPTRAGNKTPSQPSPVGRITQLGLPLAPNHQPPQIFEAHWSNELKMRPYEQNHVISLLGDARASVTGQGELSADDIYLWLKELPPPQKTLPGAPPLRWQVIADRMMAQDHVRINSPQLTGTTNLLEGWFEQVAPEAGITQAHPEGFPAGPVAFGPPSPPTDRRNSVQAAPGSPDSPTNVPRPERYAVAGERIRLKLLTGGSRTEIQDVTIDGQARFGETQTPQPGDLPLLVTGNQIEVLRANAPDTGVTVSGKPAEIAARGLEMYGDIVRMDKGISRIWIPGPGQMKLPENQSPAGAARPFGLDDPARNRASAHEPTSILRPTAVPDPLFVTWKDSMNFNGSTAEFEHSVVGESRKRKFQTDVLKVSLRRRIDFSQPQKDERPEIGRIDCSGGMWMESRSFDPRDPKKLTAIDRMQTRDLTIDEVTGGILGQGPGWFTSVRLDSADPAQSAGAPGALNPMAMPASHSAAGTNARHGSGAAHHAAAAHGGNLPERSQLNYLNVQFADALSGNLNQHEITFHDHVRSVYGPVLSWEDQLNPDDVDELGPGGVLMNCDQLTVRQTDAKPTAAAPNPHPIELEAIGNARVEGEVFNARAHRLTYTQAKDLLMLEGDGRGDAELYRQERPGDPWATTTAHQIFYWRSENRVSVDGARLFDLNQPPAPAAAPAASKEKKPK